jgi:hypothetical protein
MAEGDPPPQKPPNPDGSGQSRSTKSRKNTSTNNKKDTKQKERASTKLWIKFSEKADAAFDVGLLHIGLLRLFQEKDNNLVVYSNKGNNNNTIKNYLQTQKSTCAIIQPPSLRKRQKIRDRHPQNFVVIETFDLLKRRKNQEIHCRQTSTSNQPKKQHNPSLNLAGYSIWTANTSIIKISRIKFTTTSFPRLDSHEVAAIKNANVGSESDPEQLFEFRIFDKIIPFERNNEKLNTRALVFQVPSSISNIIHEAIARVCDNNDGHFPGCDLCSSVASN